MIDEDSEVTLKDKSLIDYMEDNITPPKIETRRIERILTKEVDRETQLYRTNRLLRVDYIESELQQIYENLGSCSEKNVILPRFEVQHNYIEDEERFLECFYAVICCLYEQAKQYLQQMQTFSLGLYAEVDSTMIMQIRKASQLLNDLESDFHRATKFASLREGSLRTSGELGNKCYKIMQQVDSLLVKLMHQESLSL